jgi:hypothetical protein
VLTRIVQFSIITSTTTQQPKRIKMATSIFSNGFKDKYKGNRAVRAAWGIFNNISGECVVSGHSLNVKCAKQTGKSNMIIHTIPTGRILKFYSKKTLSEIKLENAEFLKTNRLEIVEI